MDLGKLIVRDTHQVQISVAIKVRQPSAQVAFVPFSNSSLREVAATVILPHSDSLRPPMLGENQIDVPVSVDIA